MKPYLVALLGGALCLAATYGLTRNGQFRISLLIIVIMAIVSAVVSLQYMIRTGRRASWWTFPVAFSLGAFSAGLIAWVGNNTYQGWVGSKLKTGLMLATVEVAAISVVGSIVVLIAFLVHHYVTTRPAGNDNE